jgi:putative protein kinase ArgK-like GTPase of G3E family
MSNEDLIEEARRWVSHQWATVAVMDKDATDLVESLTDALETEVQRLRVEVARKDRALDKIRALVEDALRNRPLLDRARFSDKDALNDVQRILSDLSEHQEGSEASADE